MSERGPIPLEQFGSANEQHPTHEPALRDLPFTLGNLPRFLILGPIRLYQMTISKGLPPDTCRFYPTCSHYGYQAIYRFGVLKGGWLASWRVLRCNPFNPGGLDPVPEKD
jgi:putative membrane protein insertion efficiency factor